MRPETSTIPGECGGYFDPLGPGLQPCGHSELCHLLPGSWRQGAWQSLDEVAVAAVVVAGQQGLNLHTKPVALLGKSLSALRVDITETVRAYQVVLGQRPRHAEGL